MGLVIFGKDDLMRKIDNLILTILIRMDNEQLISDWKDWINLPIDEKRYIINHVWNPFDASIGYNTKSSIINNFIKKVNNSGIQYGIKNFGFYVYMLFIVVEDSQIRIPKEFAGILINKGVVIDKCIDKYLVKFQYGGKIEIDLKDKIVIG